MCDQTMNMSDNLDISALNNDSDDKAIRQLPDILRDNLDMVVVGITPSGALGISNHHFSGPGNHFWRCIYEVGIVPMAVTCEDDIKMLDYGIGFISFCTRPSKGGTDLSRKEMKAGAAIMVEKIKIYKPKIVVFNGIGIYEAFLGNKNFSMGLQPNRMDGTDCLIFVMPSSSARCAQLPRAEDKIPFFVSLKKLRDHLKGELPHLEEKEVIFENYIEFRVTQPDPRSLLKAERRRKRKAELILEKCQADNSQAEPPVSESVKIEETVVEQVKEEKTAVQPSISLSITSSSASVMTMNSSMVASSPILSWPHSGGLTIIHTGQQILMPAGSQSAATNTLLLFDPSGLSFSPMSMPVSQTHLQVRPLIISSDTDTKSISQPVMSFAQKQSESAPVAVASVNVVPSPNRNRPSNETLKPISSKSVQKATGSPASRPAIPPPIAILSAPPKPETVPPAPPSPAPKAEPDLVREVAPPRDGPPTPLLGVRCVPPRDPATDWELFLGGIDTGECAYPAPPQAVPVLSAAAVSEFSERSQSTCRILTVL